MVVMVEVVDTEVVVTETRMGRSGNLTLEMGVSESEGAPFWGPTLNLSP